ncbi:MAG TPA: DUF1002 domain-containing protein [Thermomicrobiales bacterium]|nr:DUF1002 domain-containing protein [Thermomicrobiales bacterium]
MGSPVKNRKRNQHTGRGGPANALPRAVAVAALLLMLLGGQFSVAFAAKHGKVITLGESLSADQRTELLNYFKAGDNDQILTVTTADTVKAMEGIFPASAITSAFSSTALTCRALGDGLDVSTNNITVVTPGLYAMALVTAGIGDATLVVAAPDGLANVQGMTALAGVFQTWDLGPCASGDTSKARQRLALEELTLTVQIGQAIGGVDGVQRATDLVLETQKTIVTKKLKSAKEIDRAIAEQENAAAVVIQPDLRAKLLDLMTRLAKEKIDWGTYSAGWTIKHDGSRIVMTGDGIAIRNARATATAEAHARQTATARAEAAMTATAAAALTATADARAASAQATADARASATAAQATVEAQMTATAEAAMTATARAQPTPTATAAPLPTATPAPLSVTGTIAGTDVGKHQVSVLPSGGTGAPTAYTLTTSVSIVREGQSATLDVIRKGDHAVLTVDGTTHQVTRLTLEPAAQAGKRQIEPWWLAIAGLTGLLLVKRRYTSEPFVLTRKSS